MTQPAAHSAPLAPRPWPRKQVQLGEFLVQAGVVLEEDIEKALKVQKSRGGRLGSILTGLGLCTEGAIRKALQEQLGVEVVDLALVRPDPSLFELVTTNLMHKHKVIPLKRLEGKLWIAMLDPHNLLAIDEIKFRTGYSHLLVTTCTEADFGRFTEDNHISKGGSGAIIEEILQEEAFYNRAINALKTEEDLSELIDDESAPLLAHKLRLASAESPIVTLCNFFLLESIRWQASDIHIEPFEKSMRVRLRIDGHLRTILTPPKKLAAAIVARIKVMGAMDITVRRLAQDGHFSVTSEGESYHFRASTIPTYYGEKCVIRLLRSAGGLSSLEELQLSPENLALFKKRLKEPQGLILMTGPTGSGKTTSVHAGLSYINGEDINIATLEDPVEVTLLGVNHIPVNKQGGVTFAGGLRSILRQDPDVIFIGEMRDAEVAGIALQAAQTGHLVISTLHTNSSVETVERLTDMGVPSYLLASSLLLVVAQRLVRRVCPVCAEPYTLSDEEIVSLGVGPARLAAARPRRGRGCDACLGTGYRGRIPVFELLNVTREVREMIRTQASPETILACARKAGTRTLMEEGVEKVLQGETTPAELRRVLRVEF